MNQSGGGILEQHENNTHEPYLQAISPISTIRGGKAGSYGVSAVVIIVVELETGW